MIYKLQNMSDKQQRYFLLPEMPTNEIIYSMLDDYLREGWFVVSVTATNNTFFIVIEKDFTLK